MQDPALVFRPLDELVPYARNARTHSAAQVAQIAGSIVEFGWTNPVLADGQGIVAGHGRVLALRQLVDAGKRVVFVGGSEIPEGTVPVIDCSGWTPAQRRAYIIADNQLALLAGWDKDLLEVELRELQADGFDLKLAGFGAEQLDELDLDLRPDDERGQSQESVLDRLEVTIAEPRHVVNSGDVWQLGKRHWLVVVRVMSGWGAWRELLTGDALFVPYPGVFAALSRKALEVPLVLVQPDVYIAAHVLDKYEEINGVGSCVRTRSGLS